jgi:hypothetical protein
MAVKSRGNHKLLKPACFIIAISVLLSISGVQAPQASAADQTVTKTAKVVNGQAGEGTRENPVPVNIGDLIEYTISVDSYSAQYDFLFLIDFSQSMLSGFAGEDESGGVEYSWSALARTKYAVKTATAEVFSRYRGSRVAYLGLNDNYPNGNDPDSVHIQVDTPFLGVGSSATLTDALNVSPEFRFDDTALFMQAAVDKMRGYGTGYGGSGPKLPGGKSVPRKYLKPRVDTSRTPVIILISDFQFGMGKVPGLPGESGDWNLFDTEVKKFKSAYPRGIFLSIKANTNDSAAKLIYGTPAHTAKLDNTISGIGGQVGGADNWGWAGFEKDMDQAAMTYALINLIEDKTPATGLSAVYDRLPPGLSYVSSNPEASVSRDAVNGDMVSWANGPHVYWKTRVFKVTAKVVGPGLFVNMASASFGTVSQVASNETFHEAKASILTLHVRQVILERGNSSIELPKLGYLQLKNNGLTQGITAPSGVHGVDDTAFASYLLTNSSSDRVYKVLDILPQYYEYTGYVVTDTNSTHDPAKRASGEISLDYAAKPEYWVTVYLKPKAVEPANYTWSTHTNQFGKIASP